MREVALMLTRAAAQAKADGKLHDERAILRALSALLSMDDGDEEDSSSGRGSRARSQGTRVGMGPGAARRAGARVTGRKRLTGRKRRTSGRKRA